MSAAEGQGSGTWLSAFGGIEKVEVDGESVDKNTAITLTVPGSNTKRCCSIQNCFNMDNR